MFNCSCDILENTPTEVYFSEFIPALVTLPDSECSATVLMTTQNEYSYFILTYTMNEIANLEDRYLGYARNYKFRVQFSGDAWASGLGYTAGSIL
jgi:hypothetical protein